MRRRLGLVALAVSSLTVIAFIVPLGILVRELASDRALVGAERDAQLIAVFVSANQGDPEAIEVVAGDGEINDNAVSVLLRESGPAEPLTVVGAPVPGGEDLERFFAGTAGRSTVAGGEAVYVPAFANGEIALVRVFVEAEKLTSGVVRAWLMLGLLGVVLIGIAAVIAAGLARSIVGPVESLSTAAGRLAQGDLSARVVPEGPPEIREVGAEFNRLAEQVSTLLEAERETAADLSHRLRTPLAALGLDVERLPAGEERERLLDDVAELQRSIDFVIHEVRRPGRRGRRATTDLSEVVTARMAFWDALAEEQSRSTTLHTPEAGPAVALDRSELEAAVDALLGNVFAHTDEGVDYTVTCEVRNGVPRLVVEDAGPGFDGTAVARGHSGAGSTGLGLDIARRTAETAGGSLSIGESPLGGARVIVEFGS